MLKQKELYEDGPLTREVTAMFGRANKAFAKVTEASKAANAHRSAEALPLIREAQKLYPEWPGWSDQIAGLEASVAYESKNYDRFLALSEEISKRHPQEAILTATVASALACKFAITGDPAFRTRAEEMLERARAQAISPEDKKAFEEYSERIRYRLRAREIIDKPEYDRRYRPAKKGK